MSAHLKLISGNTASVSKPRPDGFALHQLADRLIDEVHAGHLGFAKILASFQNLSPFGIAIVATWMTKAGLSEAEILDVVA